MLNDCQSPEEYWQTAFRCKSSWKDGIKENCYVYDFDQNRAFKMIYEYVSTLNNITKNEEHEKQLREFLDCIPVLAYNEGSLENINIEELIDQIYTNNNTNKPFERCVIENPINDNLAGFLENLEVVINDTNHIQMSGDKNDKGKTFETIVSSARTNSQDDEQKTRKDLIKIIKSVIGLVPNYLFITKEKINKIEDLFSVTDVDLFNEVVGCGLDIFKLIYDEKLVDIDKINNNIIHFNHKKNKKFENYLDGVKHRMNLVGELNNFSNDLVKTPIELIDEILDKIDDKYYLDGIKTFCNPCVKSGLFLVSIMCRILDKNLKNSEINTIIDSRLFGFCQDSRSKLLTETLFGRELKNLVVKQSPDDIKNYWEKENMPKFDVVIGNPPYNEPRKEKGHMKVKNLYPKFMELALDISNDISCMIVPQSWIFNQSRMVKFRNNFINNGLSEIYTNKQNYFNNVSVTTGVCYYLTQKGSDGLY